MPLIGESVKLGQKGSDFFVSPETIPGVLPIRSDRQPASQFFPQKVRFSPMASKKPPHQRVKRLLRKKAQSVQRRMSILPVKASCPAITRQG